MPKGKSKNKSKTTPNGGYKQHIKTGLDIKARFQALSSHIDNRFSTLAITIIELKRQLKEAKNNVFALARHYSTQDLKVLKLDDSLPDLKYANEGDAGLDIYSPVDFSLEPDEEAKIPLGYKLQIPMGFEIQLRPKSGSKGFTILNSPGTIDAGYRNEIKCKIINYTGETISFQKGYTGLCQIVLCPIIKANVEYISEDDFSTDTERGEKGFGSTEPPVAKHQKEQSPE